MGTCDPRAHHHHELHPGTTLNPSLALLWTSRCTCGTYCPVRAVCIPNMFLLHVMDTKHALAPHAHRILSSKLDAQCCAFLTLLQNDHTCTHTHAYRIHMCRANPKLETSVRNGNNPSKQLNTICLQYALALYSQLLNQRGTQNPAHPLHHTRNAAPRAACRWGSVKNKKPSVFAECS